MTKIVLTLTGVRNVTEMVKNVALIAPMADIILYVPDKCSVSLRAALSARVQLNVLFPNLKFSVSQEVTDVEEADVIIISGLVAPSKTIQRFIPLAEVTMRKLFERLTLKEDVKIVINGGVRGLICAYFLKQVKKFSDRNLVIFEPFYFAGTKTLGTTADSAFIYPTMLNFEIYKSTEDNTSQSTRSKLDELKKFPLALETIEATVLGQTIQAVDMDNLDMMSLCGKFPNEDEQKYFDIGDDVPVFMPAEGVVDEGIRMEFKKPVKKLWTDLRKVILDYETSK